MSNVFLLCIFKDHSCYHFSLIKLVILCINLLLFLRGKKSYTIREDRHNFLSQATEIPKKVVSLKSISPQQSIKIIMTQRINTSGKQDTSQLLPQRNRKYKYISNVKCMAIYLVGKVS